MIRMPPEPRRDEIAAGGELDPVSPHLAGLNLAGTVVERVLRVNDKSLLARGHHRGRPVVVKVLTTAERFWRDALAREIAVYRALAERPAPVSTPGLVHADGDELLVIDHLPGRPLDEQRYPRRTPADDTATAAVTAVHDFGRWTPPAGCLAPVFDYRDRLARYRRSFDDVSIAVLWRLLAELGEPGAPAHGDPVPSNLFLTATGTVALLDFEYTGLYLPGFDLAMLHALFTTNPAARTLIRRIVADTGIEAAFLVNLAIVLSRELRLHRELDDGPLRRERLALIEPQLAELCSELHALAPRSDRGR